MSRVSPTLAVLGMAILIADDMNSIEPIRRGLAGLKAEMFPEQERALFDAVKLALDTATPPTVTNLLALDADLKGPLFADAKRAANEEGGFGKMAAAAHEVKRRHSLSLVEKTLAAALAATRKGHLDDALGSLSSLDLGSLRGASERLADFADHDIEAEDAPRHFKLSHQRLNHALGGGLGAGGTLGLSLWVAPSNTGKSSFWWGEAAHQLKQGHWVLFLAAEAPANYIFNQIIRLHAGMREEAFALETRRRTPRFQQEAERAAGEIREYAKRGQLQVWESAFDPKTLMELAETKLAEMKDAGAEGKLLVIVDNYDALFENMDGSGGPQAVNQDMQRLQRHTREKEYHIALLAQGSSESETLMGPASADMVYGNRKLAMKVAHMVTMYRPKTPEARAMVNKEDGTPHLGSKAWLAVRKKRGMGEEGAMIEMETANMIGAWKEANSLPF